MNTHRAAAEIDPYRSLQILDELAQNDSLTQRDLSGRLGIALGLVNSYLKNLAAKGFITVTTIPRKRYTYYLTPMGFAEKTRLAYDLFRDYTRIYREAKNNLRTLFHELDEQGMRAIVFAGTDEVAEIAYLTIQETALKLVGVVDANARQQTFFGQKISPPQLIADMRFDCIIITSYLHREAIRRELLRQGVSEQKIRMIF